MTCEAVASVLRMVGASDESIVRSVQAMIALVDAQAKVLSATADLLTVLMEERARIVALLGIDGESDDLMMKRLEEFITLCRGVAAIKGMPS